MSDERSTGDRGQVPDFIPDGLLEEHEETARTLVVWRRTVEREGAGPGPLRRLRRALTRVGETRWWPVPVWLAAAIAIATWLQGDPESAALFVVAATTTVLAVLSSGLLLWRLSGVGQRRGGPPPGANDDRVEP